MLTFLDGAMGTELAKNGVKLGKFPETAVLHSSELIERIHSDYVAAGSEIIYTCSLTANPIRAQMADYDLSFIIRSAIKAARAACGANTRVALDVGPLGELLEPYGMLSHEKAYDMFCEIVKAGAQADLIVIETVSDLVEAEIALRAAKDCVKLPVFVTLTFSASGKTIMGASVEDMAESLNSLADAVGINCSLGPAQALPLITKLESLTSLPLIVKPNAGMPDVSGNFNLSAFGFAEQMKPYLTLKNAYLGGCCGTSPEYISMLRNAAGRE